MKYSVALVSVFAATALAVPATSPLDVIPVCAQSCALSNVGSSGCSITDPNIAACLCGKPDFQKAFATCVKSSTCTQAEQCKLYTDSVAQCSAVKAPTSGIPKPDGTCPGSGGSGSTSAAPEPPAATTAPAAEPSTPAETSAPAEPSSPAESSPAAEPTTAAAVPVPTGNGTAPAPPTASSPSYSNNAGTLAAKGGAAVLAVFVAVLAL